MLPRVSLAACLLLVLLAPWRAAADSPALTPGAPVERTIAGGESHAYVVAAEPGDYLHVAVSQEHADVRVITTGPDGRQLAVVDDETFWAGVEQVHLVAASAGEHRVTVEAKVASGGRYAIALRERRPAAEGDRRRVAAARAYREAHALRTGGADARKEAVGRYQEVIELWDAIGDRSRAAHTLYYLGLTFRLVGEHDQALETFRRARVLLRENGEPRWEARTLIAIGDLQVFKGQTQPALQTLDEAVAVSRAAGDVISHGLALFSVGKAYSLSGDNETALGRLRESLALHRAAGYRWGEGVVLNSIAIAHRLLADWPEALSHYADALTILREIGDRQQQANILGNIGNVYQSMGEYRKAQESHLAALAIHRELGNTANEVIVLTSIGWTYWLLGDHRSALTYYEQALPVARQVGDRRDEGILANNIGLVHAAEGRLREALTHYDRALAAKRSVDDRWGEAYTLLDIGIARWSLGEHRQALAYYEQALALTRTIRHRKGEGETLYNMGLAHASLGEHGTALDYYGRALEIQRAIGDAGAEASTMLGLARTNRDLGRLAEARRHAQAAVAAVEALRTKAASRDLRASFLASHRNTFDLYIDVLIRLDEAQPNEGYAAEALLASERARARSLLDSLGEGAGIRQGADPGLLDAERRLQQQLNARARRLAALVDDEAGEGRIASARKAVDALLLEYRQLQEQIRLASPRYAALTQPTPVTLDQIREQVVDEGSLLLEYWVGEERSVLWAVGRDGITSHVLPARAELEPVVRRYYGLLTARGRAPAGEDARARAKRIAAADAAIDAVAARLGATLLGPIGPRLDGRRLVIVADGALQYIPFRALPVPARTARTPLIERSPVVMLPSASVLAVLRREAGERRPAGNTVAVVADPVFRTDDPRVGAVPSGGAGSGDGFRRLRFSREEAAAIAALVPERQRFTAIDFAANRETVTSGALGTHRILHFATHGVIDSERPELSGLVLSLVDARGRPQDGFLRLHDIYNMQLSAELVVLSACSTALGKEIRGEGLIGLTRGFMYAGAPRVVASLWDVEDRATAELMKRFYEGMLVRRLPPSEALRRAQLSLRADARWSHPYYWSAFVIQGEWR
jgi:CHAT domain-containing protein/Tfp pilus assembly protein PilF